MRTDADLEAGLRPDAPSTVAVGGKWEGPTTEEWVARVAAPSTPDREFADDGSFRQWINPGRRVA